MMSVLPDPDVRGRCGRGVLAESSSFGSVRCESHLNVGQQLHRGLFSQHRESIAVANPLRQLAPPRFDGPSPRTCTRAMRIAGRTCSAYTLQPWTLPAPCTGPTA